MINLPDFKVWAETVSLSSGQAEIVARELEQAFKQGYYYGLNKGWQEELERNVEWQQKMIEQEKK